MVSSCARYYGVCLAMHCQFRKGFAPALQQATALRPTELLKLCPEDVMFPPDGVGRIVIRLGTNVGTKVKREQFTILDSYKFPDLAWLLRILVLCTAPGQRLFPFSYNAYLKCIRDVESLLGLNLGCTPHSPRAGYASEEASLGTPVPEIMTGGRWGSEASAKIYIDVVVAAQVNCMLALSAHAVPMRSAVANYHTFFSPEAFLADASGDGVQAEDGQAALQNRQRRVQDAAGASKRVSAGRHSVSIEPFGAFQSRHAASRASEATATGAARGSNAGAFLRQCICEPRGKGSGEGSKGGSKGQGKGCSERRFPKGLRWQRDPLVR